MSGTTQNKQKALFSGKIQKRLIQTNIKNILLVVIPINQYMLMISFETLLQHTQVKMLFTI